MPRFARCEVWSDYACFGGVRMGVVPDPLSLVTTRDVGGDESVVLTVPRSSTSLATLAIGRVLRVLRRSSSGTESFDEARIAERARVSGQQSSAFTYTARPIRFDLSRGDVAQVLSTGETAHVFSVASMTPTEIIDTYVLPALAAVGITAIARGTITPTAPLDLTFEYNNPLSLLESLVEQTMMELELRQNGTTNYLIDLIAQIGASAPRPSFFYRKNLLQDSVVDRVQDQVTRCIPRGDRLPGLQEYHTIARVLLQVANVATGGSALTLDVVDPAGSILPIAFDDQFNSWFIFRAKTGATFPIADTIKVGEQLVITGLPTIAAGEYLELRSTDQQNQHIAIPLTAPLATAAVACALPYASNSDANPKIVVVSDAGAGAIDFVIVDGQYADLVVTYCTQILSDSAVTVDGTNGRFNFTAGVGSVAVDDLVYYMPSVGSSANPPHGVAISSILWRVTSIDVGNKRVFVTPHYANRSSEALPNTTPVRAVVIRRANSQKIRTSTASTNKVELTTNFVSGTNLGQVMLIEQVCAGVLPAYVDEPIAIQAPPAGFGIIPRPLDKPGLRGEANLIQNPRFAVWTNPANPPDGWSIDAPGGGLTSEASQNTDPAFIKYGVLSWNLTLRDHQRSIATPARSPMFYVNPVGFGDLGRCAFKISLYLLEFSGDMKVSLQLQSWDPANNLLVQDLVTIVSSDTTTSVSTDIKYSAGQWLDITIPAIDAHGVFKSATRAGRGFELLVTAVDGPTAGSGPANSVAHIVLDATAAYQVSYDPGVGVYVDGSFANRLLDAANQQLLANANPAVEYSAKVIDLARLPGSPWTTDDIVKGGQIDLHDSELAFIAAPRVTRIVEDELNPDSTQLTLATLQPQLTKILAAGGA